MIRNGGEKPSDCVLSIITADNTNRWDKMLHGSGGNSGKSRSRVSGSNSQLYSWRGIC